MVHLNCVTAGQGKHVGSGVGAGSSDDDWLYMSATCYLYGLHLHKALKVPVGLLNTNWGGTIIQSWTTPAALTQCGDSTAMQASHLYNAMIAPLLNQTIKGAVWWQGESNGGAPVKYGCQLPAMIEQWRQGWHAGSNGQTAADFPFGVVQLSSVIPVVGGFSFFIKKRLKRRRRRKQNEKEGPCVMLRE